MSKRGPKLTCSCGRCLTCLQRAYQRKRRKNIANGKPLAQGGRVTAAAGNKKDVGLPNGKQARK